MSLPARLLSSLPGLLLLGWALAASGVQASPLAYIGNSADNTVSIIDTAGQLVVATPGVGALPYGVAVDKTTGTAYVTNQDGGTVSVIDGATMAVVRTLTLGGRPFGAAVSPDGDWLYVSNISDGTVLRIDTTSGEVSDRASLGGNPAGLCLSPDGATLYVALNGGDSLAALSADTLALLGGLALPDGPLGVVVLPSGLVYVSSLGPVTALEPSTVSVIDPQSLSLAASIPVGYGAHDLAASPDGASVYVSNFFDGTVSVIDTAIQTVRATVDVTPGGNVAGIDLTPSGSLAYVADVGGNAMALIDTADDSLAGFIPVGGQPYAFGTFIGPAASDAPPRVLLIKPADGAVGVSREKAVTVVFDKAMDPDSLTPETFSLRTAKGAPVAATLTYDPETFRAKLQPTAHLKSWTGYVATLDAAVTDAAGTPLGETLTWGFTTTVNSTSGSCAANPEAGFGLEWALLAGIAVFLGRRKRRPTR